MRKAVRVVCLLLAATAVACFEDRAPAQVGFDGDAPVDPYVTLCAGMLHHVVRERPLPQIHLLWGWRAEVVSAEHTGGAEGARHVVSLLYDGSTNPPTGDMPVRDRLTCEFPADDDWWLGQGQRVAGNVADRAVNRVASRACSEPEVGLLPDLVTFDGKEIRWDDRTGGRAKIRTWADAVKAELCVYGRGDLASGAAAGLGSTISPWAAKNAYQACSPMLEAVAAGDSEPPGCQALHLCLNEAPLDDAERAQLDALIEDAGCARP